MIRFHIGMVKEGYDENTKDPRYRILERAGGVKIGKTKGDATSVTLTPKGEEMLEQIAGLDKSESKNDTDFYSVPLATIRLVGVTKISKTGTERCVME